jgi:hypothetical protein
MLELHAAFLDEAEKVVPDTHTHKFCKQEFHKKQPRCKWCTMYMTANGARNTWYYCVECKVPLCKDGDCFKNFHCSVACEKVKKSSKTVKTNRLKRKREQIKN